MWETGTGEDRPAGARPMRRRAGERGVRAPAAGGSARRCWLDAGRRDCGAVKALLALALILPLVGCSTLEGAASEEVLSSACGFELAVPHGWQRLGGDELGFRAIHRTTPNETLALQAIPGAPVAEVDARFGLPLPVTGLEQRGETRRTALDGREAEEVRLAGTFHGTTVDVVALVLAHGNGTLVVSTMVDGGQVASGALLKAVQSVRLDEPRAPCRSGPAQPDPSAAGEHVLYESEARGWTMEHPVGWRVVPLGEDAITFAAPSNLSYPPSILVVVRDVPRETTLAEMERQLLEMLPGRYEEFELLATRDATLGGEPGRAIDSLETHVGEPLNATRVFALRDGEMAYAEIMRHEDEPAGFLDVAMRALATFAFG